MTDMDLGRPWRHTRWFEPHPAVTDDAKPVTMRTRHDGTVQEWSACSTCREVLVRDFL